MKNILSIRLHYTWIFVFALVTAIVTTQFSENYPLLQRLAIGVAVSLVFLAALTLREFILSLAASHREHAASRITLYVFGGVGREPRDEIVFPRQRLLYLARYSSNIVIAVIFYGLYATFVNAGNLALAELAQWLAYIFFLLFLLHFVPAFPLDGGQILRLALWRSTGDYYKATGMAALTGWIAGLLLIFAGVLVYIITLEWAISLVIVFLGWIIQSAARQTRRQIQTRLALRSIHARDIMTREYPVMPRQTQIGQIVRDHILVRGWHYIIVADGSNLQGVLTLDRIKSVPGKRWGSTTAGDIMVPFGKIAVAHPGQTADALFEEMSRRGVDYIPVLEDGSLIGVVNRNAVLGLARVRTGFNA